MIFSRTPYRISFFGGGTDYPVWYTKHGGKVLSTTIDKYAYIFCRHLPPFFEHRSRIVYSEIELVDDHEKIRHPAVREVLRHMSIERGVEIHHDGDLPARTGIGSSSSFTVGLLHALYALQACMPTKMQLAREAIHVEQDLIGEYVGSQDQTAAAFGGLNLISFQPSGEIDVQPVIVSGERLTEFSSHLLLVFTGFARHASSIAAAQVQATAFKESELTRIGAMVDEAMSVLCGSGDLADFGRLLDESWRLKRSLTNQISTPHIDAMYEAARGGGAIGGKLLGAGGGGFALFFAPPSRHERVMERLNGLMRVPFQMENAGSQIVLYQPAESADYAALDELRSAGNTSSTAPAPAFAVG